MIQITLELNDQTAQRLRKLAESSRIPPEEKAFQLLNWAVEREELLDRFSKRAREISSSLSQQTNDSVDLIREDRDER